MSTRGSRANARHIRSVRRRLYNAQQGACFYCGQRMVLVGGSLIGSPDEGVTKDHLFPRELGGTGKRNLVGAHRRCNEDKSGRLPTLDEMKRYREIYGMTASTYQALIRHLSP